MSLTFRARSRAIQVLVVLAAMAIGFALLPPMTASADASTASAEHLQRMQRATAGATGSSGLTTLQAEPSNVSECFTDAPDDTQRESDDTASDEPRADILEHCVNFGPTLSLSLRTADPTDPREGGGANWDGATFVGWFLDIDEDDSGEYFVDFSRDVGGDLVSTVHELDDEGGEANEVCTGGAAYTALEDRDHGFYTATGIDTSCIGDADSLAVSAAMFYDTSGEGDENATHYDTNPDDGSFTAVVNQSDRGTARLEGRDRMVTSTRISQERFPDGADVLYLARQDLFADAVAGGVLTDGPILLVPSCGTPPQEVLDEVERVDPDTVFALGGEVAICDDTLEETAQGRATDRLAGENRIQTAIEISQRAFADAADARFVFLARSDVFADAVTGGVLTDGPILLVNRCGPANEDVNQEIERLDPDRVVALGGVEAICEDTHDSAAGDRNQQRLAGTTRIETAVQISWFEFPDTSEDVYITRSDLFADAVVGGVLTGGPILMVPRCIASAEEFPEAVSREISRVSPERVVALGGPLAVCDVVLTRAANS